MTALDFDEIVAASQTATGLTDFDSPDDLEAFRVLIGALNSEARLLPDGAAGKRLSLIRTLSNRLRIVQARKDHPEIAAQKIKAPIIIVGLPRSGTTKLHRMICANPSVQSLTLWKILNPVPLGDDAGECDRRMAIAKAFEDGLRERQPDVYAAHPMAADQPDEDVFALELTAHIFTHCSGTRTPTFKAWLDRQSFRNAYGWLKRFVQVVQFYDGTPNGRWILKAPQHLGYLPDLLRTFPDATIVHCHRAPKVSVASYIAMIVAARRGSSAVADVAEVTDYAVEFWGRAMQRYVRDRAELEKTHKFVDVRYRDIVEDGIGTIKKICAAAGLPLTQADCDAMLAWERANAQHKHGRHGYVANSDLDDRDVAAAFANYTARFADFL